MTREKIKKSADGRTVTRIKFSSCWGKFFWFVSRRGKRLDDELKKDIERHKNELRGRIREIYERSHSH